MESQFDIFTVPSAGGKPMNVTSNPAFDHVPIFPATGSGCQRRAVRLLQWWTALRTPRSQFSRRASITSTDCQRNRSSGSLTLPARGRSLFRDLGTFSAGGGFAASLDGRTVLYTRRDSAVDDLMLVENFR
ncbi:MAG: hypothetical protein ACRD3C_17965 [Vicinamibacterales bacterium]